MRAIEAAFQSLMLIALITAAVVMGVEIITAIAEAIL